MPKAPPPTPANRFGLVLVLILIGLAALGFCTSQGGLQP